MTPSRTRRRRTPLPALLASLLGLTLTLTACSGATEPDVDGSPGSAEGFPVTIDTARGEITVPDKPERIVALTPKHLQLLSQFDEGPVGFGFANYDDDEMVSAFPWLEGTYQVEADPELLTADNTPVPEAVAALEPDLILTNIWAVDDQLYEQLSEVAPTYVGTDPDSQTSWQEDLTALATLTGHGPAVADDLRTGFESDLAARAEELPGLQGASFQVAVLAQDNVLQLTEYGNEPLLGLGLEPGGGQPTTGEEGADAPMISQENVDMLTADVVLVVTAKGSDTGGAFQAALEDDPRIAELPATQNGTFLFLTAEEWRAINGGYPASYEWWLDRVVPQLEDSELNSR